MSQITTKSILQIVAVVAIFVGTVNAAKVIVSIIVFKTTNPELQHELDLYYMTANLGFHGVLVEALPAILGFLLFILSPRVAKRIDA